MYDENDRMRAQRQNERNEKKKKQHTHCSVAYNIKGIRKKTSEKCILK